MLKRITVGFSKPKSGFVSFADAIKKVIGSDFSHTYIKFKADSFNRVLIYQASVTAVNFMAEERFNKTLQFAIDQVGTSYGMSQIFGILYVKALGLFGIKAKNPFPNGSGNYVCSELVAQILKEIIGLRSIPT